MPGQKPAQPAATEHPTGTPHGITPNAGDRLALYAAQRFIGSSLERKFKLRIPFDVYFQDPLVAASDPTLAFDEECFVPWEPGLGDGPTSGAAVVDYDAHADEITRRRGNGEQDTFCVGRRFSIEPIPAHRNSIRSTSGRSCSGRSTSSRAVSHWDGASHGASTETG
jgi:hypothetical protein